MTGAGFSCLAPAVGSINLYYCFPDEIAADGRLSRLAEVLSAGEKARRDRLKRPSDRHRFVITRVLLRTILANFVDTRPDGVHFVQGKQGKPELARESNSKDVTFNVSHTQEAIVCAVGRKQRIGIDVEKMSRRPSSHDIARRFFSPSEVDLLAQCRESKRHARFVELWTLKEAYIKALGHGLPQLLAQFSFHVNDSHDLSMSTLPGFAEDGECWRFWQWILNADSGLPVPASHEISKRESTRRYCVALAAEKVAERSSRVRFLLWSPDGIHQRDSDFVGLRRSPG